MITLKNKALDGDLLEVTYLPEKGMNMVSFKKGSVEVIDQSTKNLFEERFAGLGALIGPHFHRRRAESLPKIKDESLFPHIERVKSKGVVDPFSHGIARYAPWKAEATENSIKAVLTGKDLWNGVALSELEGQNFKMEFSAHLKPEGLFVNLSIVSDTDSVVGTHYYYHLPQGKGTIRSHVQPQYLKNQEKQPISSTWNYNEQRELVYPLDQDVDFTFYPFPDPLDGTIFLDTSDYQLKINYKSASQENGWQLYHPKDSSFVCIEPVSAQNPRKPNLTVSSLDIHLQILSS